MFELQSLNILGMCTTLPSHLRRTCMMTDPHQSLMRPSAVGDIGPNPTRTTSLDQVMRVCNTDPPDHKASDEASPQDHRQSPVRKFKSDEKSQGTGMEPSSV